VIEGLPLPPNFFGARPAETKNSLNAQSQRRGAIAPCSWTAEESEVESSEHQDNANVHCQPFPESVSEERDIYTDYNGCHRHRVKHSSYLSAHFRQHSLDDLMLDG
jgi:hypothetical protein